MHGAGNDYIYVDTSRYVIPDPSAAAIAWSKPHTGIGSDGLVLIGQPSDASKADFSMHIFNADGSEAMMCGNASRCIAKYVYERGLTQKTVIRLETLSGVKVLRLHVETDGTVSSVTVDMLEPRIHCPEQYDERVAGHVNIDGRVYEGTFVSIGNPHFVTFVDDLRAVDVAHDGSRMEHDKAFPQRCNIEFAQKVSPDVIRCRVWERGSGITQACGTGACATAVAGVLTSRVPRKSHIVMDGGTLDITWNDDDNHVYMTGPAAFVFDGDIALG